MRENKGKDPLTRELKKKLDWYVMEASDEEYDEKAVEYILYLLDSLEPFGEEEMPQTNYFWQRFLTLVQQRQQAVREEPARKENAQSRMTQGESGPTQNEGMRDGAAKNKAEIGVVIIHGMHKKGRI